jgi:hypothetical protein
MGGTRKPRHPTPKLHKERTNYSYPSIYRGRLASPSPSLWPARPLEEREGGAKTGASTLDLSFPESRTGRGGGSKFWSSLDLINALLQFLRDITNSSFGLLAL